MFASRMAVVAAMSSLVLMSSPVLAENCWYPHEMRAAQLRDFQSMLMVGTLQCKGANSAAVESYNRFVTKQRGLLDANNYVLKAHFLREEGIEKGGAAYDGYATSLANNRAARLGDPAFCPTVETFATLAEAASAAELQRLAEMVSEPPASGTCPPSNYYSGTGGPATVTVETPAAQAAVAVATPADPAPSAGNAEALQAAIVALQNATAALQAASAPAAPVTPIVSKEGGPKVVTVADAPVVPPADSESEPQ
jgi:hypothetical protein